VKNKRNIYIYFKENNNFKNVIKYYEEPDSNRYKRITERHMKEAEGGCPNAYLTQLIIDESRFSINFNNFKIIITILIIIKKECEFLIFFSF
jgi:hypothetical protein